MLVHHAHNDYHTYHAYDVKLTLRLYLKIIMMIHSYLKIFIVKIIS